MMSTDVATDELAVERIVDDDDLGALAEGWNRLAEGVPFRRPEWLHTWWRHYRRPGRELFVLIVRDADGELIGLAPWYRQRSVWGGQIVRFLGCGEVGSDYLTILAAPGCRSKVASRLAEWLATDAWPHWDLIQLDGVVTGDAAVTHLCQELARRGHLVHCRPRTGAWRLALSETWPDYLRRLSKSRRGGLRTLEKRYVESARVVVRTVERRADLLRGLEILRDLHQRRRQSLGDRGCFAGAQFRAFLAEASHAFFQRGELRLHWLELDGSPVAAEFDLAGGETVYHYQSGNDPAAMPARPGWLMQMAALRRAIDDGFRCFDFLRGDEPYKSWWRAQRQELCEVRLIGRRWSARTRHRLWTIGLDAKQRLSWTEAPKMKDPSSCGSHRC